MGLGSTAKKIQAVADTAEKLYARVNEMRQQVEAMRETVTNTEERVERLEADLAEQRALVAALAEERGIDPESVVADAGEDEGEPAAEGSTGSAASGESAGSADSTASPDADGDEQADASASR